MYVWNNRTFNMNVTSFQEVDQEADEQMKREPSRAVRIFLVKYKCILLFTFLGFAIFQMVYILVDKITSNDNFMTQFYNFLNSTRTRHAEQICKYMNERVSERASEWLLNCYSQITHCICFATAAAASVRLEYKMEMNCLDYAQWYVKNA